MKDRIDAIKSSESRDADWATVRKYRERMGLAGQNIAQKINIFTATIQSPIKTDTIFQTQNTTHDG